MSKIITKLDGKPYKGRLAAKARVTQLGISQEDAVIKKVNGGWVIEVPDELYEAAIEKIKATQEQKVKDILDTKAKIQEREEKKEEQQEQITTEESISMEALKQTVEFSGGWQPVKLLSIIDKYKIPGRVYRWVSTRLDENVLKKKAEGWVIDRDMYKYLKSSSIYNDNSGASGDTTRIRELILMWMPETLAEQRNKYYRDIANAGITQSKNQLGRELQEGGGGMYGSIQHSRG